uniref:Uncharacterized protein n=1 Tax=Podoviridae sp. ct8Lf7 TaxID=2827723 RepID=A0A8S5S0R8_9CAUD|nr:MAG TPA: hypothetical protein [Podoviridae sp. ct8Lf7]
MVSYNSFLYYRFLPKRFFSKLEIITFSHLHLTKRGWFQKPPSTIQTSPHY